jgi:hypothetical protein
LRGSNGNSFSGLGSHIVSFSRLRHNEIALRGSL